MPDNCGRNYITEFGYCVKKIVANDVLEKSVMAKDIRPAKRAGAPFYEAQCKYRSLLLSCIIPRQAKQTAGLAKAIKVIKA